MIWTHERGTLQYDIICALILAFIFLVPRSCFVGKRTGNPTAQSLRTVQPAQIGNASPKPSRIPNIP